MTRKTLELFPSSVICSYAHDQICSIQQSAVPNDAIILTQLVYLVPFSLHKKIKSSINNFFSKYDQIRLVTFPEEILNRKFHLSCSFSSMRVLILMPVTIQTPVL